MSNKQKAIDQISGLYPIDSQYPDTNDAGRKLLLEAIQESNFNWRDLPEEILIKWAEKCEIKDSENIDRFNKKYK